MLRFSRLILTTALTATIALPAVAQPLRRHHASPVHRVAATDVQKPVTATPATPARPAVAATPAATATVPGAASPTMGSSAATEARRVPDRVVAPATPSMNTGTPSAKPVPGTTPGLTTSQAPAVPTAPKAN